MAIASELALPSDGVIVDYYNKRNNRILRAEDIRVGVASDSFGTPGDTTTVLTGLRPTDINGTARVYYNRINLTDFLDDEPILIEKRVYKSISDILSEVHFEHGLNISVKEVFAKKIPVGFSDGKETLELTINMKTSPLYKGTVKIKVNYVPLSARIVNTLLAGFEVPPKEEM